MTVTSRPELLATLESSEFNRILDTPEDDWIDFKDQPYQFADEANPRLTLHGRWELCKDVAARANLEGGILLLGISTRRDALTGEELSDAVNPILRSLIDIDIYRRVITSGIAPNIRGLAIRWYQEVGVTDRGLLAIVTPEQRSNDWPFVLRRMIDENDREIHAIGIPVRNGSHTDWLTADRVHELIRSAPFADSVPNISQGVLPSADLDEAILDLVSRKAWEDTAIYFLQAIPPNASLEMPNFYGTTGAASAISNFAAMRTSGFNMRGMQGGGFEEGSLYLERMDDASLRLDSNGMLTLGVVASPAFLGWGTNPDWHSPQPVRMNSNALVEITTEFCRFVRQELMTRTQVNGWRYRIRCLRFRTGDVRLGRGAPAIHHWLLASSMQQASSDDWDKVIELGVSSGGDAYKMLVGVYGLFSLGAESIPHVRGDEIDEAEFLGIG